MRAHAVSVTEVVRTHIIIGIADGVRRHVVVLTEALVVACVGVVARVFGRITAGRGYIGCVPAEAIRVAAVNGALVAVIATGGATARAAHAAVAYVAAHAVAVIHARGAPLEADAVRRVGVNRLGRVGASIDEHRAGAYEPEVVEIDPTQRLGVGGEIVAIGVKRIRVLLADLAARDV
jgi:hypothetical protein